MLVVHKDFTSQRRFGVEYEVTANVSKADLGGFLEDFEKRNGTNRKVFVEGGEKGWAETHSNDYWHVKYDSTCGPLGKKAGQGLNPLHHGWEVASYIGCGNEDIISISKAASFLNSARVETNDNCGLHIHADAADLSVEQAGKLLSHWITLEPILLQSCPKRRKNNKFCKPLGRKVKTLKSFPTAPEQLWNIIKPTNFYPHENPQKKVTLNSVGYAAGLQCKSHYRKTIELRMPECVLEEEFVANWIRLYLNFIDVNIQRDMVDVSKVCTSLDEALITLGLEERDSFLLLSREMYNVKVWFLNRILTNSTQKKLVMAAAKKLDFITQL